MKVSFHHSDFKKRRVDTLGEKATAYTKQIRKWQKALATDQHEYALYVGQNATYLKSIRKSLKPFMGVRHVILVGIGGSSLGTEAVYQALAYKTSPSLSVLDSIDRDALIRLEQLLETVKDPEQVALVVVSKSGTTVETMTNAVRVLELCEAKFGKPIAHRTIFVGDKDTPFFRIGKKRKITCIPMPDAIGGRFSVFTAVGVVPLTLLGIDVVSLCEGAEMALSEKEMRGIEERAVSLALYAESGVHTVNFFTFNNRLKYLGYWYRQLLAESIGKNMTTKGTSFQHQLLPIVSSSVDLHSMAQLYLSGYKDLYTIFVYFDDRHPYHLSIREWLLEHVPQFKGKTTTEITDAILEGVFKAYDDQKLPFRVMELPRCSAFEIGFLLNTLMCEVMCLAHLLNIDAFDQPRVESYKKYMRLALEK